MLDWVEKVLAPYLSTAPHDVVPIIVLDQYRCHMMESVVSAIQSLGCEIIHLPSGCTSLFQPVDVGINKPLKSGIRVLWEDWMITEGIATTLTTPPSQKLIVEWVLSVYGNLAELLVRNAWKKTGYAWFD